MKEIILYQTIDGKVFTNKAEARMHEKSSFILPEDIKEPPHRSGVYRWVCKPDGKVYTGKAVDLNKRFWEFIDALNNGRQYAGRKVQRAIKQHPALDAWSYSVLRYVDDGVQLNEEEKRKIEEIPTHKALNIQYVSSKCEDRFFRTNSRILLTEDEYKTIYEKNKSLGKKHGFKFQLNWCLMNLSLKKLEISKDTIRHIPTELGHALRISVTDSTCHKQLSDIGNRPHGYYAKIVNKGVLTSVGPFENIEDCKKRYLEEKVKLIKQLLPKYKDVLEPDVFSILSNLTVEEAVKLESLK